MQRAHLIETTEIDLHFKSEELAFEMQSELDGIVKQTLIPVMKEVFDNFSNGDNILRIPLLEIDLGTVKLTDFRNELPRLLKEKLSEWFSGINIHNYDYAEISSSPENQTFHSLTARCDLVCYFLLHGYLPWHAITSFSSIEQDLFQLLDESPQLLLRFFENTPHKSTVAERLSTQFSAPLIYRLLELLTEKEVWSIRNGIEKTLTSYASSIDSSINLMKLKEHIWAACIETLFTHGLHAANLERRQSYFRGVLKKKIGLQLNQQSSRFIQTATEQLFDRNTSKEVSRIDPDQKFIFDSKQINTKQKKQFHRLLQCWSKTLLSGDFSKIKTEWLTLLNEFPQLMEAGLRHYGKQSSICHKMTCGFPDTALQQILLLLEPSEYGFISSIIKQTGIFHAASHKKPKSNIARGENLEVNKKITQQLWEYSLTYLLVERGSQFNKRSYLGYVVNKMAAASNQNYLQLLNNLSEIANEIANTNTTGRELFRSLIELQLNETGGDYSSNNRYLTAKGANAKKEQAQEELQRNLAAAILQGDFSYIRTHWQNLLSEHSCMVQNILRIYGENTEIRRQMAYQFPESVLNDMIRLLEPSEYNTITKIIAQPELFYLQSVSLLSAQDKQHTRQLWEFTFFYLLVERGRRFNRPSYLKSLIRQLIVINKLSSSVLLNGLHHQLNKLAEESPDASEILMLVTELNSDDGATTDTSLKEANKEKSLSLLVAEALILGRYECIKMHWKTLLCHHRSMLKQSLIHFGQQAETRRRLVLNFPIEALKDIVFILEPSEHQFIITIVTSFRFFKGHDDIGLMAQIQYSGTQAWEFSLAYLLVERGSCFNKKSYLQSIIRQLATANNLHYFDLISDLSQNLLTLGNKNTQENEMLYILSDMQCEAKEMVLMDAESPLIQQNAYTLYKEVWAMLVKSSRSHAQNKVATLNTQEQIDELARHSPWLLMRLLRELHNELPKDASSWVISLKHLPVLQLKQLLIALLRLKQNTNGAEDSSLLMMIKTYESTVVNRASFFRVVLQELLNDKLIDIEKIHAQSKKINHLQDAELSIPFVKNQGECSNDSPLIYMDDSQALANYLNNDKQVTLPYSQALCQAYARLLDRHPQATRQIVVDVMAHPPKLIRLIDLLSEQQLYHTLQRLGMEELNRFTLWAELLINAACSPGMQLQLGNLEQFKWQILFQYMALYGRIFNEQYFVQYFNQSLFKHSRIVTPDAFHAQLVQCLQGNELPSTKTMTGQIIQHVEVEARIELQNSKIFEADEEYPTQDSFPESDQLDSLLNDIKTIEVFPENDIYISNAGMVIANPYIQRLFDMLELLKDNEFKCSESSVRGAHILQYMVNESSHTPEYEMPLNKIMCGISLTNTMEREIYLTEHEKNTVDGLLSSIIEHWRTLKNTSISGLRETFLQREGRLQFKEDKWFLQIESNTFDMLLDKLPWGYSVIKYPWMEHAIHVEWR